MNIKRQIAIIKQMLYLSATIRNGKINLTAEENGIKNSNLSQLLKEFEDETGLALLDRKSDGVEATQAGLEFCTLAEELETTLLKFDNLCQLAAGSPELRFYHPENLKVDLGDFVGECYINYIKSDRNYDIAILNHEPESQEGMYITRLISEHNILMTTWWVASRLGNDKAAELHKFLVDSII